MKARKVRRLYNFRGQIHRALVRGVRGKLVCASAVLLDRAVELAGAELQRYRDDLAADQREREEGLEASRAAVAMAETVLEEAREMQERVLAAERSARRGLALLVEKLG